MVRSLAAVLFVLALSAFPFAPQAGAQPKPHRGHAGIVRRPFASGKPVAWPSLGGDPHHLGYRGDLALGTSNARSLGVNWMTRIYFADLGSPVVAFNPALNADVVYVGDENGDVFAVNEVTGQQLWSENVDVGDAIRSTPLYVSSDNSLWVDTIYDQTIRKLDAATGKQLCSYKTIYNVLSSPIVVTLPSGNRVVDFGVQDGAKSGPEISLDEADCSLNFAFRNYRFAPAGAFDSPASGLLPSGEPVLVFGTADIDSTMYAIDGSSGKRLWDYDVYNPPHQAGGYDIAAAPSLTAPGVNGFADGAVYVGTKYGYVYSLDLASGAVQWQYDEFGGQNVTRDDIAGMAIDGRTIVGGFLNGVYSVNAVTGAQIWQVLTTAEVESTPNIIGPAGEEITSFADLSGKFYVLAMATGHQLYSYQTGGYVTGSPAETNGHLIDVSSDGFLYDFAPGGSNIAAPSSAIDYPANTSTVANPNGNLTVRGSATDATSVGTVDVGIQSGGRGGPWWNAATAQWQSGPVSNPATLSSPGAPSTTWSLSFPIGAAGGPYSVSASAVNSGNQADRTGAASNFSVQPSGSAPSIAATSAYVPPGGTTSASANGFTPGESVAFTLNGAVVGSAAANSAGAVPLVHLTVPTAARLGPTTLMATGKTSNSTAVAAFTVGNSWTQGGGNAGHTSFESNDTILAHVLHVGPGIFISPAFYYNATSPSHSSPVIVNGTAYFGNDTGLVTAVTVSTGAPTWTYQTNSSDAIDSAPAVDRGIVYVGATDGNAYALSASTGSPISTFQIGGNVSSPATGDGYVAFTSDNGAVVVMSEASGKVVVSLNLGVAIHSSPMISSSIGAVIVGDDAGNVSALSLTNGSVIWRQKTGAAVYAPAAVANGVAYVGSTDDSLYALNLTTGAIEWTYAAAAPIRTGALLNFQGGGATAAVGDDNGDFYALNATGALLWKQQLGAAVAGVGAADDTIMVDTTDGVLWGLRPDQNGLILMHFQTGAALSTVPAVNNGAVYVASEAGGLYAFTPYGYRPFSKKNSISMRSSAVRDYPIHYEFPQQARSARFAPARRGVIVASARAYAIFWAPVANVATTRYVRGVETNLSGASIDRSVGAAVFAGSTVDRSAYPLAIDDATVQAAVKRAIVVNHWRPGVDARFLVFTERGAIAARPGICSYHSAFNTTNGRAYPAIYALVPDMTPASGCTGAFTRSSTGNAEVDSALSNATREQIEMTTDPLMPSSSGGRSGRF
jgi:outer membrane protein assembly factor BamB